MISLWVAAYVLSYADIHGQWWAFPAAMTALICIFTELSYEVIFVARRLF